jgi:chromosome segregation ATPase
MAKLTEAEVHAAAADLDAQGIKPTVTKVREKLGKGSFSTVATMLTSYEGTTKEGSDSETPNELEALLPIIWAKCEAIARERFKEEQEAIEKRVKDLEEENEALKRIVDKQAEEYEFAIEEANKQDQKIKKLESERDALKEKNAFFKGMIEGKIKFGEKTAKAKNEQPKKTKIPPNIETAAVPGMEN